MAFRRSLYSVANSGGDDVVSANGRRVRNGQLASRPGFRADRNRGGDGLSLFLLCSLAVGS